MKIRLIKPKPFKEQHKHLQVSLLHQKINIPTLLFGLLDFSFVRIVCF